MHIAYIGITYLLGYILASFLMNIKSHFKIEFLIRLFAVVNTLFDIFYMHLRYDIIIWEYPRCNISIY